MHTVLKKSSPQFFRLAPCIKLTNIILVLNFTPKKSAYAVLHYHHIYLNDLKTEYPKTLPMFNANCETCGKLTLFAFKNT